MLFLFQFKKSFEYGKSSFTIILKNWWHRSRFTDIQSETATEKIKALASRILSRKNFKRKRLLLHQRYQRPKSLWKLTKCSIQKSVKSDRSKKTYWNFLDSNTHCGNTIFLSLWFYVKMILAIREVQNMPFQYILRLWIWMFYEFLYFLKPEIE